MSRACPVCDCADERALVSIENVPVLCNVPQERRESARAVPRGRLELVACGDCGHVFNRDFDPHRVAYAPGYENSLLFSPRLRAYAEEQATRLIERYSLRGRNVVELGCGDAGFLGLLARKGVRCRGYDPSAAESTTNAAGVEIIAKDFSSSHGSLSADLVVCRQVLEHVEEPGEFLSALHASLAGCVSTAVFFEVPNALATIRDLAIWDIIYEHPSYFWPGSLALAFSRAGFRVEEIAETFDGQFLTIHAVSAEKPLAQALPAPSKLQRLRSALDAFAAEYRAKRDTWSGVLARYEKSKRRAVVWGAGSKGVMFLNIFERYASLDAAVDVNPRKRNLFVAGTGHPIIAPEDLRERHVDAIIVMNPAYRGEVRAHCHELGISAEILVA